MEHAGLNEVSSSTNRYGFKWKETWKEMNLGLLHFGSRLSDPILGRFITEDRFSFKYPFQSSFSLAANNPFKIY
jgi:RHS repeat-associated protein